MKKSIFLKNIYEKINMMFSGGSYKEGGLFLGRGLFCNCEAQLPHMVPPL